MIPNSSVINAAGLTCQLSLRCEKSERSEGRLFVKKLLKSGKEIKKGLEEESRKGFRNLGACDEIAFLFRKHVPG